MVRFIVPIVLYTKGTKQTKEVFPMKTAATKLTCRPIDRIPYPNAATPRELLRKLVDLALVAASGMGIAAMLLLLMALEW